MTEYDAARTQTITSPSNPRVKWLMGMRKRRNRDAAGVCLVEGYAELRLALEAGISPLTVHWCPDLVGETARRELLDDLASAGAETVSLSRAAFEKASVRESPDGWLAVVPSPGQPLESLQLSDQALVLVCEAVEKPGNLGALLRTADAAGLDALVAASPITDWGNPNVVRASKGTLFAVCVASASSQDVATWLLRRQLQVVAADPDGDTLVTDLDLTVPTSIVVGAEHEGLTRTWRRPLAVRARLPMRGRVNSLNVSTAAAIVVYEAIRQRQAASR
jgi:TrmH family RNA methyltransferase